MNADPRIQRPGLVTDNKTGVPDGCRRCIKCREIKVLNGDNFAHRDRKRGYFASWCRICANAHAKNKMAMRRADPIAAEQLRASKRRYSQTPKWREYKRVKSITANHVRRQRHSAQPFVWNIGLWEACKIDWKNKCAYCGALTRLTQDHFIPVSSDEFPGTVSSNMLPACAACNCSKGDRNPFVWIKDKRRLRRIVRYLVKLGADLGLMLCTS